MIKLCVEDYCDNCSEFKPDVETIEYTNGRMIALCNTTIYCARRERCEHIKTYLENQKAMRENQKEMTN